MLFVIGWAGAQAAYDIAVDRGWNGSTAGRFLPATELAALAGAMLGYVAGMGIWALGTV